MKNIAICIFFLLWLLVTVILTILGVVIVGIIALLMMSDEGWFDIPNKLINKLN
jgi:hypothetical protein